MVVPHGLGLHDPGLCGFRCVRAVGGALSPVECCVEGFPGGAFAACEGGGLEESLLAPWGVFRVLTRGVGGRFHARALTRGVALVRSPVRRAARGRLPLARSGNLPQGGVVALEVRLSWHREGRIVRLVALWLRVDAWHLWCSDRPGVIPAGVHEGIEGVVVAVMPAG